MNLYQMSISMNLFLQDGTAGRPKIVFFSTYHIQLLKTNTHWSLKTEQKMFKFYSPFENSGIKVLSPNCLSINSSYMIQDVFLLFLPNFSAKNKNVVQPTRIFCASRITWNRISDWLPIVFHFGTENWEE